MDLPGAIARVVGGEHLSVEEMSDVMGQVMDGAATAAQLGGLLVALRMKGERVQEVVGAARAMRDRATRLRVPEGVVVDTCGTGGDGGGTINVSTLAGLVVAACGVRVAKHGNRASSSRSGSADLLEALGVEVAPPVEVVERCLVEVGFGFLYAPAFHGAARHAAGPRRELGLRTLFNLLGPLTNPARVRFQVIGVYDPALLEPMAHALDGLGSERALVVHGAGGLDEIAPAGETRAAELRGGQVRRLCLRPADFGVNEEDPAGLRGGAPEDNAVAARAILEGARGAGRSSVVMAAAAALWVAGATEDLAEAARRAEAAIDQGRASALLARLVATSRRQPA